MRGGRGGPPEPGCVCRLGDHRVTGDAGGEPVGVRRVQIRLAGAASELDEKPGDERGVDDANASDPVDGVAVRVGAIGDSE